MALMDFVKRQFVDVIEWAEPSDGVLAWPFPLQDREIRHGASLVVRPSQMALLVNEGLAADLFGPGTHELTTRAMPVLAMRKNWDARFASPFKCDVHFFNTGAQASLAWGVTRDPGTPVAGVEGAPQGPSGRYQVGLVDPRVFHAEVLRRRELFTLAELEAPLRGLMRQHIGGALARSAAPGQAPAARQQAFASALRSEVSRAFEALGLRLLELSVDSLPPAMDLRRLFGPAAGTDGPARSGSSAPHEPAAPRAPAPTGAWAGVVPLRPDEVLSTLERLAELKARGILTEAEFDTKKAELLKKLL